MGIISFVGFTLLVAVIAWWATRGTDESSAEGYYLGGRSLGALTIGGSLLLTNLSAEQVVGLNGQAYDDGILVMAWETLAAIAMILTAIFLLPRYMKGGITTIPEYIEKRFDHQTKAILTILFLSGYVIVLLPSVLCAGSKAFSYMFDIPGMLNVSEDAAIWICVWSIGIIGIIYAIFGGLKAVAVSDLINAVGLLIGGLLIPIFGLMAIGDGDIIMGMNTLWERNPEKFVASGTQYSRIPIGTIFTGMMLVQMFYWGTNQAILQRVFGAKNLKEGQKGMILAALVKFLIPIIVVLPGIIAYDMFGPEFLLGEGADTDKAYPKLVKEILPVGLIGFYAAVLFGAILSSFNSLLNSSATLFGFDLYKQYIKKDATELQTVKAGKKFGLLLGFIAMLVAPLIAKAPAGIFDWLQEANGCYSIPILSVIVIGFFTKRVPAIAAKVGVISGVVLYAISQFALKPFLEGKALALAEKSGEITRRANDILNNAIYKNLLPPKEAMAQATRDAIGQIETDAYPHFLHVMAILFVFNIILMLVIGKLKPRATDFVQQATDDVDITPWKYAMIAGVLITALVLSTYFIF